MKAQHKAIHCECGEDVFGKNTMDVIRKEMDHIRVIHPDTYEEMLEDLTPEQIKTRMMRQIHTVNVITP
ncbi:hypothetical protein KW782_02885 [Candidatus Parcubacteria bacterium]|nr:hypothetical protein [Candidatus Parcubacteria bacterium]